MITIDIDNIYSKDDILKSIVAQLLKAYNPNKIILFGSQSKGTAKNGSDIDICVIMPTKNKRKLLADLYYKIDSEMPIDFVLYTPVEWECYVTEEGSFAHKINQEGRLLHG